ncbi:MAG: GNAT family N-acetyltransferase [Thermoproteota archaeon]
MVAEFRSRVIGFIDMWMFPDVVHGACLMQIQNLIVKEEFRGRGVGRELLKTAIKISEKNGYPELHVWAEKKNKHAISLYKKLGFKRESILLEMER